MEDLALSFEHIKENQAKANLDSLGVQPRVLERQAHAALELLQQLHCRLLKYRQTAQSKRFSICHRSSYELMDTS